MLAMNTEQPPPLALVITAHASLHQSLILMWGQFRVGLHPIVIGMPLAQCVYM